MATHEYNHHPLPAPPAQDQREQQYPPSSYNQSSLPQQSQARQQQQQHQSRQQQQQQQLAYPQQRQQSHSQDHQQSQRGNGQRPRSRGFSFRSDKSQKSDKGGQGHLYKVSSGGLHETHKEKQANRLNTKADPTMAMQEAEPSAIARAAINFEEKPPLSSLQHKDPTGAPIADPDRSNPTRSKWERPLDTIRSFEAAFDGGYSSRQSIYRADTDSVAGWTKRSSYYGNSNGPRFPHESYYGGRGGANNRPESTMFDPRSSAMMGGPRDTYFDGFDSGNGVNGPRNRPSRMQTDPYMSHPAVTRNVYPTPNNHKSYETVASGSGSASYGEPAGYQTDPTSSENSSINRRSPPKRHQEPKNDYGISFNQTPGYRPPTLGQPASQPRTMPDGSHAPPPPPKTGGTLLRKGSKISGVAADTGDKRKSWFGRRFSKNA